jgi:hypothetical protein
VIETQCKITLTKYPDKLNKISQKNDWNHGFRSKDKIQKTSKKMCLELAIDVFEREGGCNPLQSKERL